MKENQDNQRKVSLATMLKLAVPIVGLAACVGCGNLGVGLYNNGIPALNYDPKKGRVEAYDPKFETAEDRWDFEVERRFRSHGTPGYYTE